MLQLQYIKNPTEIAHLGVLLQKEQYRNTASQINKFLMEASVGILMSCWDSFT